MWAVKGEIGRLGWIRRRVRKVFSECVSAMLYCTLTEYSISELGSTVGLMRNARPTTERLQK